MTQEQDGTTLTKRQIKKAFRSGDMGLGTAVSYLMFDHGMDRGAALKYLGL